MSELESSLPFKNFNKMSDKLVKVLEHWLFLQHADELHNMIVNDNFDEDDCIKYIDSLKV